MTDIDVIVRDRLDRRYPALEREPDWADVLERLARTGPKTRPARYGFALVGIAAAAALVIALIGPWRESPSFTEQALAALGTGRYVHAVFRSTSSDRRLLDLASGRSRPIVERSEVVYDTKTGTEDSRWVFNTSVFAPGPGGTMADPAVTQFATGYRSALIRGDARIVGETTVDGRKAKIIRFPNPFRSRDGRVIKNLSYEDVAVATDSYVPLWVRWAQRVFPHPHLPGHIYAFPCPCTRVVSIRSSDRRAPLPTPLKRPRSSIGDITDVRDLDAAEASTALGHAALWAGRSIGGATLRRVRLQRVTTYDTSVPRWPEIGNAAGLRLDYRGARGLVQIFQSASAQGGYSFGTSFQLLPPPGEAILGCYRCEVRGAPPLWLAQFRQSGLFLVVRSKSRGLVIEAARALAPMP